LLGPFKHLRRDTQLIEHDLGARLVGLLLVINVIFQHLQVLFMVFVKELAPFGLRLCLQVTPLHFSEIARVPEHLDERLLVECLVRRLLELANSLNSLLNTLLLTKIRRDHRKLCFLFFGGLLLVDSLVLDRDRGPEFLLVNDDTLVCTVQVKADPVFAVFFHTDVQRVENLQFIFEHFSGQ